MFKKAGNYFLSIGFTWTDIFKILEIPENEWSYYKINEKYKYQSVNANDPEGLGMNSIDALFEFYILPNSIRNGDHSYSTIYDQQLGRFFETPNINYGQVLKDTRENSDNQISCLFSTSMADAKAGFAISSYLERENIILNKTLVILFDDNYLNLQDAHLTWGNIFFKTYELSYDEKWDCKIKESSINPALLFVNIGIQSQEDAQSCPLQGNFNEYFRSVQK